MLFTGEFSGRRSVPTLVRGFPVAVAFPFIVTKHHRGGKRFVVHADEILTAFLELERAVCIHLLLSEAIQTRKRNL